MRLHMTILCVASLTIASQAAAVPLTIDFTDSSWSGVNGRDSYSRTYGALDVTLKTVSGSLAFNGHESPSASSPLALHGDGIGIGNDEISWFGAQSLEVIFGSGVTVLGYHFLDFFGDEGPYGELANATLHSEAGASTLSSVGTATDAVGAYSRMDVNAAGITSMSFSAGSLEGFRTFSAFSDFSLAGIVVDVDPVRVPEPGSLGLFSLGLAGLMVGGLRCRRGATG